MFADRLSGTPERALSSTSDGMSSSKRSTEEWWLCLSGRTRRRAAEASVAINKTDMSREDCRKISEQEESWTNEAHGPVTRCRPTRCFCFLSPHCNFRTSTGSSFLKGLRGGKEATKASGGRMSVRQQRQPHPYRLGRKCSTPKPSKERTPWPLLRKANAKSKVGRREKKKKTSRSQKYNNET